MSEIALKELKLAQIQPDPHQPRNLPSLEMLLKMEKKGDTRSKEILDGLRELATSILDVGLKQPLIVYPSNEEPDKYVLFDGHRRWLAINILNQQGLAPDTIMCQVSDNFTPIMLDKTKDTDNLLGQLNVNIQRKDLNVFELARSLSKIHKRLKDNGGNARIVDQEGKIHVFEVKPGDTDDTIWNVIEKRLGIGRPRRYQILAVLKLPKKIQELAEKANLPESRIRYLIPITKQEVLEKITLEMIEKNLSNAEINKRIKELEGKSVDRAFPKPIQIKSSIHRIARYAKIMASEKNIPRIMSNKDIRTVEGYKELIPELREVVQNMQEMLSKLEFLEKK